MANMATSLYTQQEKCPVAASCTALLGAIKKEEAQYPAAIELFEKALSIAKSEKNGAKEAEYLADIGGIFMKTAKFKEAGEKYDQALAKCKAVLGPKSANTAEILNAIGLLAKKSSQYLL